MGITNGINPVEIWLFKPKHLYSDRKRLRETCFLGALCLQSEGWELSHPFLIPFFCKANQSVKSHGNHAENHNGHQHPIHFKYLGGIDDEVAKAAFRGNKFSDDNAD